MTPPIDPDSKTTSDVVVGVIVILMLLVGCIVPALIAAWD